MFLHLALIFSWPLLPKTLV